TNIFKKDIVKRHDEKDLKHQKARQQFSTLVLKIIRQMKCVYFAAKKHLSFNVYPDLYRAVIIFLQILKYLKIFALSLKESSEYKGYGTYLNHVATRKFAMDVIEEKLINEIKLAKNWSIMIDESNSIDEKHLVIPVIRYMGVMKLEDCRAQRNARE
ncbi:6487_t:CDS:1, partial [Gigaspora rosea]